MERLWAPWRMEYVSAPKGHEETGTCIFCDKPKQDDDASNYILHRGDNCFVILNSFPYNSGHLMVVPYAHVADYSELDLATRDELGSLTALSIELLKSSYKPGGFNVGINQGAPAGAGIAGHIHQHVVPRWNGDTNFMPVVADTRVLPEALERCHEKLAAAFGDR